MKGTCEKAALIVQEPSLNRRCMLELALLERYMPPTACRKPYLKQKVHSLLVFSFDLPQPPEGKRNKRRRSEGDMSLKKGSSKKHQTL